MVGRPSNSLERELIAQFDRWRREKRLSPRKAAFKLEIHPSTMGRIFKSGAASADVAMRMREILTNQRQDGAGQSSSELPAEMLQILQELARLLPQIDTALDIVLNGARPAAEKGGDND